MGLGDDLKQVAGQVVSDVAGVATDTAKAVAKTPLDILEEILGSDPGGGDKGKAPDAQSEMEKGNSGAGDDAAKMAAIQQQSADDQKLTQQKLQMHRSVMAEQQQFYEQKKAQDEQVKQVEKKQEEEKKVFEIQQLQHDRQENLQLQTAQMANDAERSRNMGAG